MASELKYPVGFQFVSPEAQIDDADGYEPSDNAHALAWRFAEVTLRILTHFIPTESIQISTDTVSRALEFGDLAGDFAVEYTRRQLKQDGFYRKILPPLLIEESDDEEADEET